MDFIISESKNNFRYVTNPLFSVSSFGVTQAVSIVAVVIVVAVVVSIVAVVIIVAVAVSIVAVVIVP